MAEPTNSCFKKNIVVLGGSYGGVSVAHYLLKRVLSRLPSQDKYQVVLVSPSVQVMCRPACPRALISDDMFPQDKLFVGILFAFKSYANNTFRFLRGTATSMAHVNRIITVNLMNNEGTNTLAYHAPIIATGASTPSPLLGLNCDSEYLRRSWAEFRKALPKTKSIVIAGGGPAGVETAGEFGEYLNGRAGWSRSILENPKTAITLVTAASEILPALRPAIARKAENYLAKVGVSVLKGVRVENVHPAVAGVEEVAAKATITLDNGKTLEADLYIPATGTISNTNFIDSSLLLSDGRTNTNPSTLRVDKAGPRVYAIGDASSFARPAIHNTLSAIPALCSNIKRDLHLASENSELAES
ncbi:amid-like mitochondrial protein [Colletotrichum incanum]|nr:amid-like mitochondrial protein [Colletotrichum incanum]